VQSGSGALDADPSRDAETDRLAVPLFDDLAAPSLKAFDVRLADRSAEMTKLYADRDARSAVLTLKSLVSRRPWRQVHPRLVRQRRFFSSHGGAPQKASHQWSGQQHHDAASALLLEGVVHGHGGSVTPCSGCGQSTGQNIG
jgi:hypothetical protein